MIEGCSSEDPFWSESVGVGKSTRHLREKRARPPMKREWRSRRASSYISSTHIWEYIIQREGRPTRSHFCPIGSVSSLWPGRKTFSSAWNFSFSRLPGREPKLSRNYLDALKRKSRDLGYSRSAVDLTRRIQLLSSNGRAYYQMAVGLYFLS